MEYLEDGTFDFSLGQDAWHHPDRIKENQYASGVNVSTKGGILTPRPGYHEVDLTFGDSTVTTKFGKIRTEADLWRAGKFQAMIPYSRSPENYLLFVIGGLIFRTNIRTGRTGLLTQDVKLSQYASRVNWALADGKVILFDFPDYPVIVDGEDVRRADPNHKINGALFPEVPISTNGTYNQNRLFVTNNGIEFTAGDPTGNLATPEAPITFTELFAPSSPYINQIFTLPNEESSTEITAMGNIQELDSNTGVGPMFLATDNSIYFYRTNQPRSDWTQSQFGGQLLANAGMAGSRAFVNVNSDVVFLSGEGKVHAFSTARNEAKKWGNVSISREVENYLKFNDRKLKRFAVVGYFDNRIYITTNPYRVQVQDRDQRSTVDYAHGGFVVLEIENTASFLEQGSPVWAGLWTGINPMDMAVVGGRCFIIEKEGTNGWGANHLYEVKRDSHVDVVRKQKRRVRSVVYTRMYNFKQDFTLKREHTVALHMQDLEGDVEVQIERQPSHGHEFSFYGDWRHTAPVETPDMPMDFQLEGFAPHQFREITFGDAVSSSCNVLTKDEYHTFRACQLRITIQGDYWTLEDVKMRVRTVPFEERQEPEMCDETLSMRIPKQEIPDWKIPEEAMCQ